MTHFTTVERDAILAAIDAKACHLTGRRWEGGNGKDKRWPRSGDGTPCDGIP